MAVKVTVEIDTKPLERLLVNAFRLDGEAILYGIPEPAPMHRGDGSRPPTVSTAFTLARVEFGPPHRVTEPAPSARGPKRRRLGLGRVARAARAVLGRLLRGFKRGKAVAKKGPALAPTNPGGERPVLRWVAAARRGEMVDGFKAAAKQALAGKDPRPDLEVLGGKLADLARARITEVRAVRTGQTRDAITYKIVRRYGPGGGVLRNP